MGSFSGQNPKRDKEMKNFIKDVEKANELKQSHKKEIICEEPHTWFNHVGGSLNMKSRLHKPHHTVESTPYMNESFFLRHISWILNEPRKSVAKKVSVPIERRHSTGSIKLHSTVEDMDVEGIVDVISLILHHHIQRGSNLKFDIAPQFLIFDDSAMTFGMYNSTHFPSYEQVHDFFSYVHRTAQLECDCVVSSLLYIERLLIETAGMFRMCENNWKSIILSGMILASKVWDDLSMWSIDFARVGHLTLNRINQLEVALLEALLYNVRIDSSTFARYFFQLRHWSLLLTGAKEEAKKRADIRMSDDLVIFSGGNGLLEPAPMIRDCRSKSVPDVVSETLDIIKQSRSLTSCEFESVYKNLFPCMEEIISGPMRDAGGRKECVKDLKDHERSRRIGSYMSSCRNKSENAFIENCVSIEVEETENFYETKPTRIIGVGISGIVQIVREKSTNLEYAMKTIQFDRLENFRKKEELQNEIDILSYLSHPNIVRLVKIYESPVKDSLSLIMELCTGGELLARLNRLGRFSETTCANLAKKMLSAVEHCHSNNICHRDLKLENWVFESEHEDAELKLIDFGLSRHFEKNEVMHVPVGTPYSIAPEVLSGEYTSACDIWSIGVLVFMLLTGKKPFDGKDDFETLDTIKTEKWVWPNHSKVSSEAKDFVEKMMVANVSERWSATQALNHPWLIAKSKKIGARFYSKSSSKISTLSKCEDRLSLKVIFDSLLSKPSESNETESNSSYSEEGMVKKGKNKEKCSSGNDKEPLSDFQRLFNIFEHSSNKAKGVVNSMRNRTASVKK